MSDSPELVSDFATFCDEIVESKLILAEGKISNLLRTIASSTILFRLFSEVMDGLDFAAEFSKCRSTNSFKREGLRFPTNRRTHIAVVFTLLVEFDSKRRDLLAFLNEFYSGEGDVVDAYRAFVRTVIIAFKNNVLFLLSDETGESEEGGGYMGGLAERIALLIEGVIQNVSKCEDISVEEREEVLLLCEALASSVRSDRDRISLLAWIGLKNSLALYGIACPSELTSSMNKLLNE